MPKKKPIDKRLKNLFEAAKPEQTPAEFKPAPSKRAPEEKPVQQAEANQASKSQRAAELVSPVSPSASALSLAFQAGHNSWATLQVVDESQPRSWSQDEQ